MCLGGCTITSKKKVNVFWNFFFTPSLLRGSSTQFFFSKNIDFSLWGKHCIVLPKWTFFIILQFKKNICTFYDILHAVCTTSKNLYLQTSCSYPHIVLYLCIYYTTLPFLFLQLCSVLYCILVWCGEKREDIFGSYITTTIFLALFKF